MYENACRIIKKIGVCVWILQCKYHVTRQISDVEILKLQKQAFVKI